MFELDGDLDLDEDFLEEVFQSENQALKKKEGETEKRSSRVDDDAGQSSKKHRLSDDNFDNDNEIKGYKESGNKNGCLSTVERRTLKELTRFDSSDDMRITQDIFSSDERTEAVHENIVSREIAPVVITPKRPPIRQRKFPGPAGLLPERSDMLNRSVLPTLTTTVADSSEDTMCSQSSSSVFESALWLLVMSDFGLTDKRSPLSQFNIKWVKRRAAARRLLDQKVPFLALILHNVDCSSPDPCVTLRDTTGEIHGTLHREVWEQHGGQLEQGSVLVLRQVGVLSTGLSSRRHYLNVTSNNILNIYSNGDDIRNTTVHKMSRSELLRSVSEWQARTPTPDTTPSSPSMFSTVATPQTLYNTVGSTALREATNVSPRLPTNQFVKKVNPRSEESPSLNRDLLSAIPKPCASATNFNSQLQQVTKQVTSSPVFKGGFTPKVARFGNSPGSQMKASSANASLSSSVPNSMIFPSTPIANSRNFSTSVLNCSTPISNNRNCSTPIQKSINPRIPIQNSRTSSTPISNSRNCSELILNSINSNASVSNSTEIIATKCKENETVISCSVFQQQDVDVLEGLDASCLFDDF